MTSIKNAVHYTAPVGGDITQKQHDTLIVANCQGWLRHIKTHYSKPECATKCPCYTLEHPINLDNITENEVIMNPFFADELWIYLLRLCPPASYFPLILTCKQLYFIGTLTRFFPNIDNIRRARPKRYLV
jgi:hypothetical protein